MIVRLTAGAEHDLAAIGDHIAADNPDRAVSFLYELRDACLGLADMPERFPVVPRYEAQRVRRRVHGNYLIFYVVGDDAVTVIHVLHGARDYGEVLGPG